jgi:uracil-DNA glycosylase family 4
MSEALFDEIRACTRCDLHKKLPGGCFPVQGVGNLKASIMLVGEALGENEVNHQKPFMGLAGQLLNKILLDAGLVRDDLFVCNTVNCRPFEGKKNRPPTKDEINKCKGWLWQQIVLVNPKIIITLGKVPSSTLLHEVIGKNPVMKEIVGKEHTVSYHTATIIPAYHPSYLLQHGRFYLEQTTELFKKVKELNDEL